MFRSPDSKEVTSNLHEFDRPTSASR